MICKGGEGRWFYFALVSLRDAYPGEGEATLLKTAGSKVNGKKNSPPLIRAFYFKPGGGFSFSFSFSLRADQKQKLKDGGGLGGGELCGYFFSPALQVAIAAIALYSLFLSNRSCLQLICCF